MNPLSPSQWAVFCTGKIVHVVMRFIIPYFFMPFGKMVSWTPLSLSLSTFTDSFTCIGLDEYYL